MNKKRNLILFLLFLIIVFFLFKKCSATRPLALQKEGPAYYVPIDATVILSFSPSAILNKIEFDQLRPTKEYQSQLQTYYNQNPVFTTVFSNPSTAGIELGDLAVFYLDVGNNKEEVYTATILSLDDKNKLEAIINKIGLPIKGSTHYNSCTIDPASSVAWNYDMVMFITTNESINKEDLLSDLFRKDRKKYYDQHEKFDSFIDELGKDVGIWIDGSSYARNQILAKAKEGEFNTLLLQDNYIYGSVDFGKGFIDSDIIFDLNPVIEKGVNTLFKNERNSQVLSKMPKGNPSFIGQVSLDIDGMFGLLLKNSELKLEARNALAEDGLMIEDFGKAFTGEVTFGSFRNENATYNSMLFGLEIKDLAHFDQLLEVMYQLGKIQQIENNLYRMNTSFVPFLPFNVTYEDNLQRMLIKDGYMFVSLDKDIIEPLQNQEFISLEHLLSNNQNDVLSIYGDKDFKSLKIYTDQFSIEKYRAGFDGKTLTLSLVLLDKNQSSLKQILNLD